MEIVLAGVAFVGMFTMWVILPKRFRKDRE